MRVGNEDMRFTGFYSEIKTSESLSNKKLFSDPSEENSSAFSRVIQSEDKV